MGGLPEGPASSALTAPQPQDQDASLRAAAARALGALACRELGARDALRSGALPLLLAAAGAALRTAAPAGTGEGLPSACTPAGSSGHCCGASSASGGSGGNSARGGQAAAVGCSPPNVRSAALAALAALASHECGRAALSALRGALGALVVRAQAESEPSRSAAVLDILFACTQVGSPSSGAEGAGCDQSGGRSPAQPPGLPHLHGAAARHALRAQSGYRAACTTPPAAGARACGSHAHPQMRGNDAVIGPLVHNAVAVPALARLLEPAAGAPAVRASAARVLGVLCATRPDAAAQAVAAGCVPHLVQMAQEGGLDEGAGVVHEGAGAAPARVAGQQQGGVSCVASTAAAAARPRAAALLALMSVTRGIDGKLALAQVGRGAAYSAALPGA